MSILGPRLAEILRVISIYKRVVPHWHRRKLRLPTIVLNRYFGLVINVLRAYLAGNKEVITPHLYQGVDPLHCKHIKMAAILFLIALLDGDVPPTVIRIPPLSFREIDEEAVCTRVLPYLPLKQGRSISLSCSAERQHPTCPFSKRGMTRFFEGWEILLYN